MDVKVLALGFDYIVIQYDKMDTNFFSQISWNICYKLIEDECEEEKKKEEEQKEEDEE